LCDVTGQVLNAEQIDDPDAAARFLREICSAANLNHQNIVIAYAALQIGTSLVFAMEYVEGADLARVVKERGVLPVANACYYAQQAAFGLQHASDKGTVHRVKIAIRAPSPFFPSIKLVETWKWVTHFFSTVTTIFHHFHHFPPFLARSCHTVPIGATGSN